MRDFNLNNTAVLAVDLQNENFTGGKWPVADNETVLTNAAAILGAARRRGAPVVYTRHMIDPWGRDAFKYENDAPAHSVAGTWGAEICDSVTPEADDLIVDKSRFSPFYGSRLEIVLRRLGAEHLIVLGVWTEACLQGAVWDALWRDYRVSLVKDACGGGSRAIHKATMLTLANWLYGGMVFRSAELVRALDGADYDAWAFERPQTFPSTTETLDALYDRLG